MVNNVFYFINTTCCQGKALFITDAQAKYTNHVQDKQTTHVKVIILKYENAYSSITRVKVVFFLSRHMYLLNDESVLYFC